MKHKETIVYLDSCVFIAFFAGEEGRVPYCKATFDAAANDQIRAITSAFSHAEIIKGLKDEDPNETEKKIASFLRNRWLHTINVDRLIGARARSLFRELEAENLKLKPPDVVAVATAIERKAEFLYTYDDKILRLKDEWGITVCEPKGELALPFAPAPAAPVVVVPVAAPSAAKK